MGMEKENLGLFFPATAASHTLEWNTLNNYVFDSNVWKGAEADKKRVTRP